MIRYAATPVPSSSCRQTVIASMADTMAEMAFAGENVTPETLESRGFPRAITARLGRAAVDLARRRAVRRVER